MQEDIVVMERSIGKDLGTCTLCGYPYPIRTLRLREGEPGAGVRSGHAQVCPTCDHLQHRGDEPGLSCDETAHLEGDRPLPRAAFESAADEWWGHLDDPDWDDTRTMIPDDGEEGLPWR